MAFPPNAARANDVLIDEEFQQGQNQPPFLVGQSDEFQRSYNKRRLTDLQRLFGGSEERIVRELKHQFDRP